MASFDYDIGILGGGAAGLTVAAGAAQIGAKTLLVEKDNKLGGDCLYYGCVPSKTLIRTAHVYHIMKNAKGFGLPEINLPPVDYQEIGKRIQSVISIIQKHDSEERFCKLGAQVEFGDATFIDEHTIRLNDKKYNAKTWVIATGSSPAIPPIEGLDATRYITNKEIYSLEKLPKSMIILGGGPIGIEFAQAFTRLGTKVFVVERLSQILSADDKDLTDMVMDILKAEGVEFHLDSSVVRTRDLGNEKEVVFKKGNETRGLRAEVLVVATGRKANTGGMGLKDIGVDLDRRGLKLDAKLRTTQRHIYGAGDVTGTYQFTHAAGYEGGVVLSNAIFRFPRKVNYTLFPWVTYSDPELASIGMNEQAAQAAGIKYSVWKEEFKDNDRSLAEGEKKGQLKMLLDEKEKPIGVQILGPQAGDLLNEWVTVMNGKVKLTTLASAVHPYPTLGEINKRVAGSFIATKVFSGKVKKVLKLFFNLKGRACGYATDSDTKNDTT
jgi:pyruvate/2-oxoglutarate dehydrogenase complex dihydrolipoamide dehydrogenase (E3) component